MYIYIYIYIYICVCVWEDSLIFFERFGQLTISCRASLTKSDGIRAIDGPLNW